MMEEYKEPSESPQKAKVKACINISIKVFKVIELSKKAEQKEKMVPGTLVHAYNPRTLGGRSGWIT